MSWTKSWRDRQWAPDDVARMYRLMVRIRKFEEVGSARYDRGDFVGPYHSSIGQEATYVGALSALRSEDKMTSHHRSHGHQIAVGAPLSGLAAEIWGRGTGLCKGKGGSMHLADFSAGALGASGLLAGGFGIAAGAALAMKLDELESVVVCFFGDGAVNEGIVHETMNWAALWRLPLIFVCENNQYSITMWYRDVTSVDMVSKRASAYGMPGHTVDGQNVLDVATACEDAVSRARSGGGPSIVECLTYRYSEHSLRMVLPRDRIGAAPRARYRNDSEVAMWEARDPISLFAEWAVDAKSLSEEEIAQIVTEEQAKVDEAWSFAESSEWPSEEEIWTDTWPDPVPLDERISLD